MSGHVINKVGTLQLALAANAYEVPFIGWFRIPIAMPRAGRRAESATGGCTGRRRRRWRAAVSRRQPRRGRWSASLIEHQAMAIATCPAMPVLRAKGVPFMPIRSELLLANRPDEDRRSETIDRPVHGLPVPCHAPGDAAAARACREAYAAARTLVRGAQPRRSSAPRRACCLRSMSMPSLMSRSARALGRSIRPNARRSPLRRGRSHARRLCGLHVHCRPREQP